MADNFALAEFRQGIKLLKNGYPSDAYQHFNRAAAVEQHNSYFLSFLGLSAARAQTKWASAVALCETALKLKRNEAQLYLNLAEVYESAGRRGDAVAVLDRGLIYFNDHPRIRRARGNLGNRSSSALPFLNRRHFLNRSLGKLRHHLLEHLRRYEFFRLSRIEIHPNNSPALPKAKT